MCCIWGRPGPYKAYARPGPQSTTPEAARFGYRKETRLALVLVKDKTLQISLESRPPDLWVCESGRHKTEPAQCITNIT